MSIPLTLEEENMQIESRHEFVKADIDCVDF